MKKLNHRSVWATVLVVGGLGWLLLRLVEQRREIQGIRQALSLAQPVEAQSGPVPATTNAAPSAELLQARAEVAGLLQESAARQRTASSARRSGQSEAESAELDRLMKGRRPSDFPDFVPAADTRLRGFGTPEDALESFWWHFAAPGRLQPDTFTNLWWSPATNAPEGYHFEVFLGQGVGGLTGYRVARREDVSADEVVFHLQREEGRGVVEEIARFVRVQDRWLRMPTVRLLKNEP